jgi:hypothetical protein
LPHDQNLLISDRSGQRQTQQMGGFHCSQLIDIALIDVRTHACTRIGFCHKGHREHIIRNAYSDPTARFTAGGFSFQ